MRPRILLAAFIVPALVVLAATGAVFTGFFEESVVASDIDRPLDAAKMKALAARGAYVARAADCYACHTAKDGAPWAGGRAIDTPFGTIYSTNISPDKETGIGAWTRADFHRALRDGVGKGGKHLYPAMPYTSYRNMTPGDVDAVYAYLMTREPMKVENRENALQFPFNIRQALTVWNLVNLQDGDVAVDAARSAAWNRGRYIVDALAHCGECHTPRNFMQAMERDRYLEGAVLAGVEAPDITRDGLSRMGFDARILATFMKSGVSAQGSMTHEMFEVVHFSTQYMTQNDLDALAVYLFERDAMPRTPTPPPAPAPVVVDPRLAASAHATYLNLCAGCHGIEGQGIPHVSVPLNTNATLRLDSARNLVRAVLYGIPAQHFPGLERMQAMPGFERLIGDRELAGLVNWMRARWGGRKPNVTAADVASLRNRDMTTSVADRP